MMDRNFANVLVEAQTRQTAKLGVVRADQGRKSGAQSIALAMHCRGAALRLIP
jgi:hypothetical protein